ncbi:MAG: beta strand repeat-containing protein [Planctomycetia bacterium]
MLGVVFSALPVDTALGQTSYFFSGGTKTWSNSASWWLNYAGTQAASATPGANDTAVFNISGSNAAGVAVFTSSTSLGGMQVLATATGALTLRGGGADQTLTLGAGGIRVLTSSTSALTIGSTTTNQGLDVVLGASQQWRFGNSLLSLNDQIRAAAGSGASQTLMIQTTSTAVATTASAVMATNAAFADGADGRRLNLWFNTPGRIRLSSSNPLTGTLTFQSSLAQALADSPAGFDVASGSSLSTVQVLQLAGGNIATGTSVGPSLTLSGSGTVRLLGGSSVVVSGITIAGIGTLQRATGGGFLGLTSSGAQLTDITNDPNTNGLMLGFYGVRGIFMGVDTVTGTARGVTVTQQSGSITAANFLTSATANYQLNYNQTVQTLSANAVGNSLALETTSGSNQGIYAPLDLGSRTLTLNALGYRQSGATSSGNSYGSTSTISASGGGLVIGPSGELAISIFSNNLAISAPISGSGWVTLGVVSTYGGMLDRSFTLSGSNSHTGGTSIVSRGLNLNNAHALGSGTFRIGGNGIVLDNTSAGPISIATNNLQEWNSDFSFRGTQDLNLGTGAVSLGNWAGSWRTITTNGTATLTVGGPIGNGSYADLPTTGVIKSGSGVLVLSGNNTYTGGTEFAEGVLSVTSDANLGASSAPLVFNGGALRIAGTSLASLSTNRPVSAVVDQPFWFDVADASHTFTVGQNLAQQGGAGLTKTGLGVLSLTGTSTFTARTQVREGVVQVATINDSGASPLGTNTTTDLGSGATAGTLRWVGATSGTTSRTFNLAGTTGGGIIEASGAGVLVITSTVTATGVGAKTLTLGGSGTAANTIGVILDGSGTTSVVKDGPGQWRINAASGYTGSFTVRNGTLVAAVDSGESGQNGVFGATSSPGASVSVGDATAGAEGTAALLLAAGVNSNRVINIPESLGGSQVVVLGSQGTSGTSASFDQQIRLGRAVTLMAATSGTTIFGNTWTDSSGTASPTVNVSIGSSGNLGTVLLKNDLTTTGLVGVRFGTLNVDDSKTLTAAGIVGIDSGATLAGVGTVAAMLGGAGFVAPGNSPGILTAQAVNPTGGLAFNFEFMGAGPSYGTGTASVNDVLRLTGSTAFTALLTGSNAINVYLDVGNLSEGNTFRGGFFTNQPGSFATSIAAATYTYWVSGTGAGQTTYLNKTYVPFSDQYSSLQMAVTTVSDTATFFGESPTSGQVMQFTVVVPEPGTLALAALGLGLAGYALRRRRAA